MGRNLGYIGVDGDALATVGIVLEGGIEALARFVAPRPKPRKLAANDTKREGVVDRTGLTGLSRDISRAIRRFETGKKTIDTNMAEKVQALVLAHEGSD